MNNGQRFRKKKAIYASSEDALSERFTRRLSSHGWDFKPTVAFKDSAGHWVPPGYRVIPPSHVSEHGATASSTRPTKGLMTRKQTIKKAIKRGPSASYPIAKKPLRPRYPKFGGPDNGRPKTGIGGGLKTPSKGGRQYLMGSSTPGQITPSGTGTDPLKPGPPVGFGEPGNKTRAWKQIGRRKHRHRK